MVALANNTTKLLSYNNSRKLQHTLYMVEMERDIQSGKRSLWSIDFIPWTRQEYKITPQTLFNALMFYRNTTDSITKVLNQYNIDKDSFWKLLGKYQEIRDLFETGHEIKGHAYNSAAVDLYDEMPAWLWDKNADGIPRMSGPAVNYIRNKHDCYQKQAVIHNPDRYADKTKIDIVSRSASLVVDSKDIPSKDTASLLTLFTGRR